LPRRSRPVTQPAAAPPPGWSQSLWNGGCGDWQAAHQWVRNLTRDPVTAHPDICGLHLGAPAVAYVLHAAGQPGYATALAILDAHVATLTRTRLRRAHQRIEARQRPALAEYDLIRGLTGIGAYLLHRGHDDQLRDVLAYLVRLTHPLTTLDGQTLPGWWTPRAPHDRPSPRWP